MNGINLSQMVTKTDNKDLRITLKKLNLKTRNKVRAIYASEDKDAVKILNKLREELPVQKILDVEKILSSFQNTETILPEIFPKKFQTKESYTRLAPLSLDRQLSLLNYLVKDNYKKIDLYIASLGKLNNLIINHEFGEASLEIKLITEKFGTSHCLLRKVVLVNEANEVSQDHSHPQDSYLTELLNEAVSDSKVITSSLIHCYQEEQDYLGIKRSIMGLQIQGNSNKYTRDISRLAFHAHAKDIPELSEFIQSNLQSSLLDALIIIKVNSNLLDLANYEYIVDSINKLENIAPVLDEIFSINKSIENRDIEYIFLKQSSAWLESKAVVSYRYLVDHFYDTPESEYFDITSKLIERAGQKILPENIVDLLSGDNLIDEGGEVLHIAMSKGTVARSSIFNYLVYTKQSELSISEEQLYGLMSKTSDLDRTIHVPSMKNILPMIPSKQAKLILRLLIAKKSKCEVDQITLKSLMEKTLKETHDGNLINLVDDMSKKSEALAFYLYETCNEDFIARMTRVIRSTGEITKTRAALHTWRGLYSDESLYLDRARNLTINSQIDKIRGEIDDHRIYVDTTRFSEWFVDDISSQMGSLLLIIDNSESLNQAENPQLTDLIDQCFNIFCSNSFFGISSYLGRRIRHGTFRGHIYSSVINHIENKYSLLLKSNLVDVEWSKWKDNYEKRVTKIIDEKLYLNSPQKKLGFLYPNLRDPAKKPIVKKYNSIIFKHFEVVGNIVGIETIIIEACWRIAEVDLKKFNSYIKSKKAYLHDSSVRIDFTNFNLNQERTKLAREFEKELHNLISEKLNTICTWFNKPQSVSPKASLNLLYKAVVSEVQQTFDSFDPNTDFEEKDDIELYGGVYHIFYDALYVIIYNAAKHGKPKGNLIRDFYIQESNSKRTLYLKVHSEIKDDADENIINKCLKVHPDECVNNAQVIENRSGIKKLYNLHILDEKYKIEVVECKDKYVLTEFSYELGY